MRVVFPVLALVLAGCASSPVATGGGGKKIPAPKPEQEKASREIAEPRMQFAFGLKDRLIADSTTENVCFSPLSVDLCLSMLLNGAIGQTRDDLAKTLFVAGKSIDTVNDGSYNLVAALLGDSFTCANSIWTKTTDPVKPEFKDKIENSYRGEIFALPDFGSATVDRINKWTSDQTKGRIPTLFGELARDTSAVLVNALTFDGKWNQPFPKTATSPEDFKLGSGQAIKVPTMHLQSHFAYGEQGETKALRMGYTGGKFSMLFILPPSKGSAAAFLHGLTAKDFDKLTSPMRQEMVTVAIPKFEFRGNYDLVAPLSDMGMAALFKGANLSGIAADLGNQTSISQVIHKTYIQVYEEGTKAAAATGISVATASAPRPEEPKVFQADRPFLFALMHNDTGTIVFLGLVNDPR